VINDLGDLRDNLARLCYDGYYLPRNHAWNMRSLLDYPAIKAKLTGLFSQRR